MKSKVTRPAVGTVIEIALPNGKYAYGRVYEDAGLAVYRELSDIRGSPPIGSRDFQFIVGVYDDLFTSKKCKVVGKDPFEGGEDSWPPAHCVVDAISGDCNIYHHGKMEPALPEECREMEIAAVWNLDQVIDRILNGDDSKYLKSLRTGLPEKKSKIQ
jgi:hypothetical protein